MKKGSSDGQHVGMITKERWTFFDGQAWTEAAAPVKNPVQAVSCGQDIYVIDSTKGPLCWYDGREWKLLELPGREDYPRFYERRKQSPGGVEWKMQQYFSVCGDTVLFVEPDKTGKRILCWRKLKGSPWKGPPELVSEETPIADLVAPRYGLPDFTPIAYNCWSDERKQAEKLGAWKAHSRRDLKPWIKVLKVPAGK